MKRPSLKSIRTWIIVVTLAGLAVYKLQFAPISVIAHTLVKGEIIAEVMGTGTLEARVKTTMSARIQERLMEVLVDQGDSVKAGQLLARLDNAESKQQVAIAEAALAAARLSAARVQADLARSEAVLTQAKLNHERMSGLIVTKAVSQSDADKSAEALLVAEADLKRSNAAIAESASQIGVAEKNLLYRQKQLAFTEIHAPYDGLIIRRDRDAGEMLVPGASLMEIISLDEIWVSAWVDETAMPSLKVEQPARITFRSMPTRSFPGKVSRLGRETDRETREFLVDVRVTTLPENWTIGQRTEVFIETGRKSDAILLPSAFVTWKEGRAGVFVNAGGKAEWREITPGLRATDQLSVAKGLTAGEQVLRLPDRQKSPLAEGQRIKLP
ncbi:MAG: efflux RND transporter periplasmic adaptor subunit [Akkermansiaceae bacterium]|jgi:HlyD family secretion protein|nr:efflux RND transporter periplasmic adaptor subunit [Akkermansiaceae bacterium]